MDVLLCVWCTDGVRRQYLWSHSPYWLNLEAIWSEWPSRGVSGLMKWYLLVQLSFWLQQIIVVNVEEKRKDYFQMFTHHIITSALLSSAYIYSFYNVSNVVLCMMDVVDILLPVGCSSSSSCVCRLTVRQVAKVFKYFKYETCCTVSFVLMMVTWLFSRHVFYLTLCWSIYKNVPAHMAYGCYSGATGEMISSDGYPDRWGHLFYPFVDLEGPICMNRSIKWIFLSFLLAIQTLSVVWFAMVIRVAVGVLRTGNAEDERSDEEEAAEEEESETGVKDGTNGAAMASESTGRNGPAAVRSRGRGRVRLGDQNERRALLGRIGCEKPVSG